MSTHNICGYPLLSGAMIQDIYFQIFGPHRNIYRGIEWLDKTKQNQGKRSKWQSSNRRSNFKNLIKKIYMCIIHKSVLIRHHLYILYKENCLIHDQCIILMPP